jgi:hypothetical protein
MRTVIILGLTMIAFAIRENVITSDYGRHFVGGVIITAIVMDIIEFFNKLIDNK